MANLMDLVRELKQLNARKKAGEVLAPDEEARRRELKTYLKSALESQQGGDGDASESTNIKDTPSRVPSSVLKSAESSAPKPQPPPRGAQPQAVSLDPPAPAPAFKPFVPKKDAYAIKGVDDLLHVAEKTAGQEAEDDAPKFVADDIPLDEDVPPPATIGEQPAPAGPPKPYVPKKDAFAIKGSGLEDLVRSAAASDAVAKADPWASKKAKASTTELSEAEEKAERALKAQKTRERATNADDAAAQLQQIESQYTPPEEDYALEQYYGAYEEEGYEYVPDAALAPIDSRELELAKATGAVASTAAPAGGSANATAPPGLAFLDDFPALYQKRVLPPPDEEVVVDSDDPNLLVPGKRKVTVHMLNGEKKTGAIRVLRRGDLGFRLEPSGSGLPEEISIAQCKAVFIHLQPNAQVRGGAGRTLTVTFKDQRTVQGASDDYQPGTQVFSIVPPAGRGQFERIIVNVAAVAAVR